MSGTVYNTHGPAQPQAGYKLKFEVEEVPAYKRMQRMATKSSVDKGGLVFTDVLVDVPAAWVVYFPAGHSVRIESKQEMIRLGYMSAPPVIDMETGEEVPGMEDLSPKQIVQRATQRSRGVTN